MKTRERKIKKLRYTENGKRRENIEGKKKGGSLGEPSKRREHLEMARQDTKAEEEPRKTTKASEDGNRSFALSFLVRTNEDDLR